MHGYANGSGETSLTVFFLTRYFIPRKRSGKIKMIGTKVLEYRNIDAKETGNEA